MRDGIWHREAKGKRYHQYGCPQCGHLWTDRGRYPLWPISFFARWKLLTMRNARGRLRWSRILRWSRHWVQVGADGPERPIHCTIVQWLFLGIRFGPMVKHWRAPVQYVPSHGWYPRDIAERIERHLAEQPVERAGQVLAYHCLICDMPISLPEHAAVHGWDMECVRQVGYESGVHEFGIPGGPSLFWAEHER